MSLDWMDVSGLSFNSLLLLERVQLAWLPGWRLPEPELQIALHANPVVEWYLRHKCPEIAGWLDKSLAQSLPDVEDGRIRAAEVCVLKSMVDLLVYALDPAVYDAQPFLNWDSTELTGLVDFQAATVIDVGSGTGRLAISAAQAGAKTVFAIEPVANLRDFLRQKARRLGLTGIYPLDGLITRIPFPDGFADVTISGHVYGDDLQAEADELERVTRPAGMVILCPGSNDPGGAVQEYLTRVRRYSCASYEEPRDGPKLKYWRRLPLSGVG